MHISKKAFSLVELLVAISVIAILGSLAIVGINAVRNQASATKEISNLRQIGVALKTYNADNNGYYPFLNLAPENIHNPDAPPLDFWSLQLKDYLPHELVEDDQQSVFQSPLTPKENRHYISDYGANMYIFTDAQYANPSRATRRTSVYDIDEPAQLVAVMTAWHRPASDRDDNWVGSWMVQSQQYVEGASANAVPHPRLKSLPKYNTSLDGFNGAIGVLFCDGRVESIDWKSFHDNRREYLEL